MTGHRLVPTATSLVIFLAFLNGLTHLIPSISPAVDLLTRPNEQSAVEYAEAFLWISSFFGFCTLLWRQFKVNGPSFLKLSYFTLALMCFLVFGEETSWGQHFGLISPSAEMQEMNAQKEFNLHNTNLSKLLAIPESHPLYDKLSNAGNLISPIFQLFCVTAFGLIPLLYGKIAHKLPSFVGDYPFPSTRVSYFIIGSFVAYLIVDKIFFDVAILVELAMAMTGLMVVLDRLETDKHSSTKL